MLLCVCVSACVSVCVCVRDGEGPILRLSIPEELTRAFNARIAKLSNVDRLPDVYPRALDTLADHAASSVMCVDPKDPHKSQDRGPNLLRQALALPAPPAAAAAEAPEVEMADAAPTPARGARAPPVLPSNLTKAQKARLLALLGWDAEELPAGTCVCVCVCAPARRHANIALLAEDACATMALRCTSTCLGSEMTCVSYVCVCVYVLSMSDRERRAPSQHHERLPAHQRRLRARTPGRGPRRWPQRRAGRSGGSGDRGCRSPASAVQ